MMRKRVKQELPEPCGLAHKAKGQPQQIRVSLLDKAPNNNNKCSLVLKINNQREKNLA